MELFITLIVLRCEKTGENMKERGEIDNGGDRDTRKKQEKGDECLD